MATVQAIKSQQLTTAATNNTGNGTDEVIEGTDRQRQKGRLQGGAREAATNTMVRPATSKASGK